jgi:hypothetical protein
VRPEVKFWVIKKHTSKFSVAAVCKFFGVSRSGYYAYLKSTKEDRDQELAMLIRQCQKETDHTYGYRRVCLWLDRKGMHVNQKRVYRVMNHYGLFSEIRRRRKYQQMAEQLHRYPNLLNREFSATCPNEKWVTDISYIPTPQGTLYLSMIRDLYDNSIIDYKMGTQQSETCKGYFHYYFYVLRSKTKWFCPSSLRLTLHPIRISSVSSFGSIAAIINIGNSMRSGFFSSVSWK